MNKDDQAILEGLISKLTSLRRTLSDEEQALLDQMVIDAQPEFVFHALHTNASVAAEYIDKAVEGKLAMGAIAVEQTTDKDEISLHAVTESSVKDEFISPSVDASLETGEIAIDEDEVSLHAATAGYVKDEAVTEQVQSAISFDKETEKYVLTGSPPIIE